MKGADTRHSISPNPDIVSTAKKHEKRTAMQRFFSISQLYALYFITLEASCADVVGRNLALRLVSNFLNVDVERSSCSAVGMADIVTRCTTLTANTAHSRHIFTSDGKFRIFSRTEKSLYGNLQYHTMSFTKKQLKRALKMEFFVFFQEIFTISLAKKAIIG